MPGRSDRARRRSSLVLLAGVLFAACAEPDGPGTGETPAADRSAAADGVSATPNIVVVLVDDLRWD